MSEPLPAPDDPPDETDDPDTPDNEEADDNLAPEQVSDDSTPAA